MIGKQSMWNSAVHKCGQITASQVLRQMPRQKSILIVARGAEEGLLFGCLGGGEGGGGNHRIINFEIAKNV